MANQDRVLRPPAFIGAIAVAVAIVVSLYAMGRWEAWWTVLLVPLSFVVVWIERQPLRGSDAILSAVGLIGSIALGGVGALLTLIGLSGPYVPCGADCQSPLLLPGISALLLASAGLTASIWSIRRLRRTENRKTRVG